jgi:cytochrome c-type biogenesis protein CcmF
MTRENPVRALFALVGRNRRRYGGYTVHVGMAVLFIGVAASSAFNHNREVEMKPGDKATVGGFEFQYVKATRRIDAAGSGQLQKIALGAVIDVRKDGKKVATMKPERGFYPSLDAEQFGPVGAFFNGEANSEIGLKAGALRDIWTAIAPDLVRLQPIIQRENQRVVALTGRTSPEEQSRQTAAGIGAVINGYMASPRATFHLITSPLVTWIWIGALIVFGGGLIAMWPAPDAARRRATARLAARVAQDLGRTESRSPASI